jgi:hypothetical protein
VRCDGFESTRSYRRASLMASQTSRFVSSILCSWKPARAHEWARRFRDCGHTVRLMALKSVVAYRKGGKNDGNDAEAICEAVSRPNMRFVPVKTVDQQAVLTAGSRRLSLAV